MRHPRLFTTLCAAALAIAGADIASAGDATAEGCFFESTHLQARIAGDTPEARRVAVEKRGAELKAAVAAETASAGDIESDEEALAQAGMCVYPPGYVDTLAQDSMAPPRKPATVTEKSPTDETIDRALASRRYAGGMTALPLPLSSLIAGRRTGG